MAKKVSEELAAARLKKDAGKVKEKDVKTVLDRAAEIRKQFDSKGPLSRFIKDVKLMLSMMKDYSDGTYREIPWWAVASVVAALLYVLSPIDVIPDVIPVIGLMDDAAVVAACLVMVEQQLHEYEEWKIAQPA